MLGGAEREGLKGHAYGAAIWIRIVLPDRRAAHAGSRAMQAK
jgi:hypothetical protein